MNPSLAGKPRRSTKIEWTEATWNPVAGCRKVSPGCAHCYAEPLTWRLANNPSTPQYHGLAVLDAHGRPRFTGNARLAPSRLEEPLNWRGGRMVFVNSMSDPFHEDVSLHDIVAVWSTMARTERHVYQILTKRACRMQDLVSWMGTHSAEDLAFLYRRAANGAALDIVPPWPLPNVWLGVSVEDRRHGLPRIDHLRRTPAALRFLSIEPLLEDLGEINLDGIGWVIVGGESGAGARPMEPDWARRVRDQCIAAGVPFFFKQWGEWVTEGQAPDEITLPSTSRLFKGHGNTSYFKVGKKAAGHLLDGVEWRQMPVRP